MARAFLAALSIVASLLWSSTARGDDACPCLVEPAPDGDPLDGPSRRELQGLLAGGIVGAGAGYLLGLFVARGDRALGPVDAVPVVGTLAIAMQHPREAHDRPLLIFSAGVQAMSLLVVAAAATELVKLRGVSVSAGAAPGAYDLRLTWRFH